jgi:hypothetical protein
MQREQAIMEIQMAHRRRRFAIGVQMKLENSLLGSVLFNHVGVVKWDEVNDTERAKLVLKAQKLIQDSRKRGDPNTDAVRIFVETTDKAKIPATEMRLQAEKDMAGLAQHLPAYGWWTAMEGLGAIGLATIIAEAGDLSNYPGIYPEGHALAGQIRPKRQGIDCLIKRLGFAPYDGCAGSTWTRASRRPRDLSKEEWIANPFSGRRYSFIQQVGYNFIKMRQLIGKAKTESGRSEPKGRYGEYYCYRYARTEITHPEWTAGHRDADALRYAIKKLLRDLWQQWRREVTGGVIRPVPAMATHDVPIPLPAADPVAMSGMPDGQSFFAARSAA